MPRNLPTLLAAAPLAALALPAVAEDALPSVLSGHALVPAMTMSVPPADAPRETWISGKFTTAARVDTPMTVPGNTGGLHGNRPTGLSVPFLGQPFQGISGYAHDRAGDGSIYALIDNGFGSRLNSPDALLSFTRIAPDFSTGAVEIVDRVWLHDPDGVIPFRITHEATEERYLTGADFDTESIQVVGDTVWIGEEFGPYLFSATLDGRITGIWETEFEGEVLRSPDHPRLRVGAEAGTDYRVPRSSGYEGMAMTPDGSLLWAMLEKPILTGAGESEGRFLRVLAFDPAAGAWTGDSFKFPLADGVTAIGDFNFIDATRALVIERDNGEGDPSLKCAGDPQPDCFPHPAMVKRVTLIDTAEIDAEGFVRKIAHIDLMDIDDPDGRARLETAAARDMTGTFTMPFFTIESVMRDGEAHIIVGMDNNLPFSSGRALDRAADNEMVRLFVPELLGAQ